MTSTRSGFFIFFRKLAGSKPEVLVIENNGTNIEGLHRQQDTNAYWMDIIEVVGFSVIGKSLKI